MFSPLMIPLNAVAERATACCTFLDGMPAVFQPVNVSITRFAVDSALLGVLRERRQIERVNADLNVARANQLEARTLLRDRIRDARQVARGLGASVPASLGRSPSLLASAATLDDLALNIQFAREPHLMASNRWAESCVEVTLARHALEDAHKLLRSRIVDRRSRRKALWSDTGHLRSVLNGLDRLVSAHLERMPGLAAQWRAIVKGTASAVTARAA